MIVAGALLLFLTLSVLAPFYYCTQVRTRLTLGGERELFWISIVLSLTCGVALLEGEAGALLDRTDVTQLEVYHQIRSGVASCEALLWHAPAQGMQALPLCFGAQELSLLFIVTIITWSALLAALFCAATALGGPLGGAAAVLLVLTDSRVRDPFSVLSPECLCVAAFALLVCAVVTARTLRQAVISLSWVVVCASLCMEVAPFSWRGMNAAELLSIVVPFSVVALGGWYLLHFFSRGLRRQFLDVVGLRRQFVVWALISAIAGYQIYRGQDGIALGAYIALLLAVAVGFGAVLGGVLRFLAVHPVAAPVLMLLGALGVLLFPPPPRAHPPGIVSLASDIAAIAPTGTIVASSITPALLQEFLPGREVINHSELVDRLRGGGIRSYVVETRFLPPQERSTLRQNLQLDQVLPGIYRLQRINASAP